MNKNKKEPIYDNNDLLPKDLNAQLNKLMNSVITYATVLTLNIIILLLIGGSIIRDDLVYNKGVLPLLLIISIISYFLSIKELHKERYIFNKVYLKNESIEIYGLLYGKYDNQEKGD